MKKRLLIIFIFSLKLSSLLYAQCDPVGIVTSSESTFNTSGTTSSHSYQLRPASNRLLVVGVGGEDNNGDNNVTGVTYGGIPMNAATDLAEHTQNGATSVFARFFYLAESDLAGLGIGNHNIVVTNNGNVGDFALNVMLLENVDQTALILDNASDNETDDNVDIDLTANATTDFIVAMNIHGDAGNNVTVTGATESFDVNAGNFRNILAANSTPNVGSNQIVSDNGNTNVQNVMVGFVVSQATCGYSCDPVGIVTSSESTFNTSGTTSSHSYQLRPASNRLLVVGVGGEDNNGDNNVTGVTYGGIPMNAATDLAEHTQNGATSVFARFFYLAESDLAGLGIGNHNIVVTNNGNVGDFALNVMLLENVDQTALILDNASDNETDDNVDIDLTANATTDFIVAMNIHGDAGNNVTVTGAIESFDVNAGNFRNILAANSTPNVGSNQIVSDNGNTNVQNVMVGFVVAAHCSTCPDVVISGAPSSVSTIAAFNVTFEFDTDVTDFVIGDITVGNGTASNFVAVDGNTYTADITPTGSGNITIDVNADVVTDCNNSATTVTVSYSIDNGCGPASSVSGSVFSVDSDNTGTVTTIGAYQLFSGERRLLVIGVSGEDDTGFHNVTDITYGGIAMTAASPLAEAFDGSRNNYTQFFYLDELALSALTDGVSYDIIVTNNGTVTNFAVVVITLEGVNQTNPIYDNDSATGDTNNLSVSLSAETDEDFMLVMGSHGNENAFTNGAYGTTEEVDDQGSGATYRFGLASKASPIVGTDNNQIGMTTSGSNRFAITAITVSPASADINCSIILPVSLVSFSTSLIDNKTHLNWTTASEFNNDYFELQKSKNGLDWEVFSKVNGAGSSNQLINYSYVDNYPYSGTTYYRLRQVDYDGKHEYSNVRTVTLDSHNRRGNIIVYPNPTSGDDIHIALDGLDAGDVEYISMVDILGRMVYEKSFQNNVESDLALVFDKKLISGQYILNVYFKDGSSQKLHVLVQDR
ncbi:Ig-like domain-containing protein [Flammeovirgaceae bacterium SG7u.111]|nr:Ig-like domain-containing protein [Flammeovirgaceae bacterium SG7u.132]WPO38328.1 Ig-like domain-containing protein [Flammeovirgaceae bacterium SG7u.111]